MCEWSVREAVRRRRAAAAPYLGALRVAPRYRHRHPRAQGRFDGRAATLLDAAGATPYALTAIAADNRAALRLLGANLPGMPTYRPLEPFSTFALRPRARRRHGHPGRARARR